MSQNNDIYYSGNETLTHNCLFNFIIGNRGCGKTYWSKNWAIRDFLKTGSQFVYVRRYDTEFEKGKKEKFFDDIRNEFPEHKLKVKGYEALIDDKPAGQFMSLSKAKIEKSTPFPLVNKIIFDEFILDKGNYYYLPDEVVNFLELYATIARSRNNVRVFFLSNAITITNPYFLYWGMHPNPNKRYTKPKEDLLIELVQNKDFIEMQKQTRFGKLVSGTAYGDYAIENQFLRDSDTFVQKKTAKAKNFFVLKYKGQSYGVWIDYSAGKYFVSDDVDPSCKIVYSTTLEDHSPNTLLLKGGQSKILKTFVNNYRMGNVLFESINIKNIVYEIVRMSLI
jgi:hypothetical protein